MYNIILECVTKNTNAVNTIRFTHTTTKTTLSPLDAFDLSGAEGKWLLDFVLRKNNDLKNKYKKKIHELSVRERISCCPTTLSA